MSNLDRYRVPFIPTGRSGDWAVLDFMLSEEDLKRQRDELLRQGVVMSAEVPPGKYVGLFRGQNLEQLVMSDTPDEIADGMPFVAQAHGRVLVGGLGLGCILQALVEKPEVTTVTIIEQSLDVLQLVWPHHKPRIPRTKLVEVFHASIFDWKIPDDTTWDCAWFDIWDQVVPANIPEMETLMARYRPYVTGLIENWCETDCRTMRAHQDSLGKCLLKSEYGVCQLSSGHDDAHQFVK